MQHTFRHLDWWEAAHVSADLDALGCTMPHPETGLRGHRRARCRFLARQEREVVLLEPGGAIVALQIGSGVNRMDGKITGVIQNAQAFGEKGRQVEPGHLVAFGSPISSRYGRAGELRELLNFAQQAATACVAQYVKSAFYDSQADLCCFELDASIQYGGEVERELRAVVDKSISQCDWFGAVRGFS